MNRDSGDRYVERIGDGGMNATVEAIPAVGFVPIGRDWDVGQRRQAHEALVRFAESYGYFLELVFIQDPRDPFGAFLLAMDAVTGLGDSVLIIPMPCADGGLECRWDITVFKKDGDYVRTLIR